MYYSRCVEMIGKQILNMVVSFDTVVTLKRDNQKSDLHRLQICPGGFKNCLHPDFSDLHR